MLPSSVVQPSRLAVPSRIRLYNHSRRTIRVSASKNSKQITIPTNQPHNLKFPEPLLPTAASSADEHTTDLKLPDWIPNWRSGLALLSLGAVTGGGLFGSGFDISGPESVLEAIGVLAAVVGIHEAGHFYAARSQGIHVSKFAIGFGPVLWSLQKDEVEYSLRAFPLGGFVAFPDDDPESSYEPDDPDLLRNRPVFDRIKVTIAGVVANIIFAYAICLVQAGTVGIAEPVYLPGVKLGVVSSETVAGMAGLKQGDVILKVDDLEVTDSTKSVSRVVDKIKRSPGKSLPLKVIRGREPIDIRVTPAEQPDGTGRIGVSLGPNAIIKRIRASNPVQGVTLATKDFVALSKTIFNGLSQFVRNFKETAGSVSGPVAILAVGSEVARTDAPGLFQFAALLNINLAAVNILPLPALDGGALAFLLVELLRGKRINPDTEACITYAGTSFLILAAIYLVTRDVENLTEQMLTARQLRP